MDSSPKEDIGASDLLVEYIISSTDLTGDEETNIMEELHGTVKEMEFKGKIQGVVDG